MTRVEPVAPPFPPELQAIFDRIMPPGVPPLALFTTLARVPRVYERFRAGSLLDRGPVAMRHREIVIHRTCARCGCAYEWGVHAAFFAERTGLTAAQLHATIAGGADDPVWSKDEQLLIRLADELHDSANVSDALWQALTAAFSIEQIFECMALAGFYHTVSFFANGLRLPLEPFAVALPSLPADDERAPEYARDLVATVERSAPALEGLPDAETTRRPSPEKWSPREILGHLIDSASNNHQRFVRAQFTDDLVFPGYEQDSWVRVQRYQEAPWPDLIRLWRGLNLHLARVMAATPEAERTRPRRRHNLHQIAWRAVPAAEPATLDYFMADYVGHLKHHLRQILGPNQ
jgi:hypothetical protein